MGCSAQRRCARNFYGKLHEATGIELSYEADEIEVYSEVAWLRDHWRNLGDPRRWTVALGEARTDFVSRCLTSLDRDVADVKDQSFFKTHGHISKVVSQGDGRSRNSIGVP